MSQKVYVIGVGMTKFEKPGVRSWDYPDIGREAATAALTDAGVDYSAVEAAFLSYVLGDSTSGQRALYEVGMTGIPAVNVNNNCSSGSSALYLARSFVRGGVADCVLALGFERMSRGSLAASFEDRVSPLDRHFADLMTRWEPENAPPAPYMWAVAGREYTKRYGTSPESFARVAEKNHRHSANNPNSQFQDVYTLDEILQAPLICDPLTRLQCSPTSDGGAAAVLASERFVTEHGLRDRAVEIVGQSLVTDTEATFGDDFAVVGQDMTRRAAAGVYAESGLGPEDVDVIELHDCFSVNEILTYEGLGLCPAGAGAALVDEGATTYGGSWVVNPSGGLISKGHPLGATGLAQCAELSWQLRGTAGGRQVENASVALQHNLGLGGAAVVTMYRKPS